MGGRQGVEPRNGEKATDSDSTVGKDEVEQQCVDRSGLTAGMD